MIFRFSKAKEFIKSLESQLSSIFINLLIYKWMLPLTVVITLVPCTVKAQQFAAPQEMFKFEISEFVFKKSLFEGIDSIDFFGIIRIKSHHFFREGFSEFVGSPVKFCNSISVSSKNMEGDCGGDAGDSCNKKTHNSPLYDSLLILCFAFGCLLGCIFIYLLDFFI